MSEDFKVDVIDFKALSNPTRRSILEYIADMQWVTYTQLTEKFELKSGPLYYHLRQIKRFVYQDEHKKYYLTEEGKKAIEIIQGKNDKKVEIVYREKEEEHRVFSIGKFSLAKFIRFFAKNPIHTIIEFVILAGVSVYLGVGNKILIVGNFVVTLEVPLWLAYLSLLGSWLFVGVFSELIARFGYKKKEKSLALLNVSNLIFLPSFLFVLSVALAGLASGTTVVVPSIIMLILHGVFQIWSFLVIITALGEIKELSIDKSALIAMFVSYSQILALIFILL
ncbi:MAG: helix-turn-helix transcriptional regulator [Candidatus Heimdallarchaeota archaeon]|nr:helix-turn-helix transcriptional regulator [Candidatus Heimdallarchaeota archaeon]MCK4611989.1 helix-turn-helix transcriptional regulator [Candidatus Heimdallarchaeota archaeon]